MHGRDCEGVGEHASLVADVLLRSVVNIHSWVLTSLAPQNLSHLQTPGAIRAQDSEQSGHMAPAVEIVLRLQVIPSISQVRFALWLCFYMLLRCCASDGACPAHMHQVKQADWDACATGSGEVNPFLLWAFLNALEESGSAVSRP